MKEEQTTNAHKVCLSNKRHDSFGTNIYTNVLEHYCTSDWLRKQIKLGRHDGLLKKKRFSTLFSLALSVHQDFHGCTQPFFIYAQNIMVYNLAAHNYVSLKDNPNKVYIKLKGIGCTIWKCKVKSVKVDLCVLGKTEERRKKRLKFFYYFLSSYLGITLS